MSTQQIQQGEGEPRTGEVQVPQTAGNAMWLIITVAIVLAGIYFLIPQKKRGQSSSAQATVVPVQKHDASVLSVSWDQLRTPKQNGHVWWDETNVKIGSSGLVIQLNETKKSKRMEISLDNNDDYTIAFIRENTEVASRKVEKTPIEGGGLFVHAFDIPEEATRKGFSAIRVVPGAGDNTYIVGHISLVD